MLMIDSPIIAFVAFQLILLLWKNCTFLCQPTFNALKLWNPKS